MAKDVKIVPVDVKLKIFHEVFGVFVEHKSVRDKLMDIIQAKEESELADLEVNLLKLEIDILNGKKGGNNGI